jgi:hypothetical protein
MHSLIIAAFIIANSGSFASNLMVPVDYAHRLVCEDGISRTAPHPDVAPIPRTDNLGSVMVDYTPEGTIWLPELVVIAPRPSKSRTGKAEVSGVDIAPDGSIWLEETVVTAERLTPAAARWSILADVLPLLTAGAIVGLTLMIGFALLPTHHPVCPEDMVPVYVRVHKKV